MVKDQKFPAVIARAWVVADVEKPLEPQVLPAGVFVDAMVFTRPPVVTPVAKLAGAGDPVIPHAFRTKKFQCTKVTCARQARGMSHQRNLTIVRRQLSGAGGRSKIYRRCKQWRVALRFSIFLGNRIGVQHK